ncbi:MAG TPA: HAMP domain-containing sensor histidine kinase, partial [Williamwhitmania sp.]|nr:HAMP domain-containing sensor histidine kinase [Williamwhitmania sp.]
MKLIRVTSAYQLVMTAVLLALAGAGLFFAILRIQQQETDEALKAQHDDLVSYIKQGKPPFSIPPMMVVNRIDSTMIAAPSIATIEISDTVEGDSEPYRQLISVAKVGDSYYQITVRTSLLEQQDLLVAIGTAIGVVYALLLLGFYLIGLFLSKRIWHPFYATLHRLQQFNVADGGILNLPTTSIVEFQEMNAALEHLTTKVQSDYKALKSFTENASHEIQTPLTLIITKLETLMQDSSLPHEKVDQVHSAYQHALRLSRLNSTLLLLVKIENRQFKMEEEVDVLTLIQELLEQLSDFMEVKQLKVNYNIASRPTWIGNAELASIMVGNILRNAVQHSNSAG